MADSPFAPATAQAADIRDGRTSSHDRVRLYLDRIRRHNPTLHAIVIGNEDDAVRTARERDEELKNGAVRGPLHGVAVTVKESFNIAGLKTTVNTPQLRHNVATSDAFVVQRVKEAGAAILGKTNIPTMLADFQSYGPIYPAANNPWDTARTPGGSTGGGAAAVAAGLTAMEFGSDMGGSIRLPSHFCGVFGLKPTDNMGMHGEGHVPPLPGSRSGFVAMASAGPLARTMADIELAWTVINEASWRYFFHLPARPRGKRHLEQYRVAWFDDAGRVSCGDDTRRVLGEFIRTLEGAGVRTAKRSFDQAWLDSAYAVWGILFGAILGQDSSWIVRQIIKYQLRTMGRGAVTPMLGALHTGLNLRFVDVSRAIKQRMDLVAELDRQFDEYDFIVSPIAAGPAFRHNHKSRPVNLDGTTLAYGDYVLPFTAPYSACGNPVLVVPAGRSASGLPIGLQIAAPHYAEEELIHFGKLVEQLGMRFVPPEGY